MALFRGVLGQGLISVALAVACAACYALIILLFMKPEVYNIDSLINPDSKTLKPTVAVSLVALVLQAATVTLVTRCVEHSLWINLAKEPQGDGFKDNLTVGETRRLAQWSTSTLERLTYLFGSFSARDRRSWLLRISGPLLVATATVSPVLLVGITQTLVQVASTTSVPRAADPWLSRLDTGNVRFRGGNSFDNPTFVAALASMRNFSAPVAPLCQDTDSRSTCSVSARAVAIKATCSSKSESNPNGVGTISSAGISNSTFCTGQNTERQLCVQLQASSPATYSMFKSGLPACSTSNTTDCPAAGIKGQWAKIFGAWVNGVDITSNSEHRLNFVDCDITYGNITVVQNGTSPPFLHRSSFTISPSTEGHQWGYSTYDIFQLNRIYTELGNSPYDWKLAAVGRGANTIYATPVAFLLLGQDANNDADTVARQIEANFDMATLHSFARGSNSSDLVFTRTQRHPIYVYNREVLLILLVPFIATLLGSWARWRVAGEKVSIGYDPIAIARLGPVAGLTPGIPPTDAIKKQEDSFKVWRWTRVSNDPYQQGSSAIGLQACDPSPEVSHQHEGISK